LGRAGKFTLCLSSPFDNQNNVMVTKKNTGQHRHPVLIEIPEYR